MKVRSSFYLIKNKSSFIRFIKEYESYAKLTINLYESNPWRTDKDFDEVVDSIKLVELDKEFRSILTKEESSALKYLHETKPEFAKPDNYDELMSSSYEKWLETFFKDKSYLYDELNPVVLGKVMKMIRIDNEMKKTELAEKLQVDRATVFLVESGKRLPSLTYFFRFARLFNVSMDSIIELEFTN